MEEMKWNHRYFLTRKGVVSLDIEIGTRFVHFSYGMWIFMSVISLYRKRIS